MYYPQQQYYQPQQQQPQYYQPQIQRLGINGRTIRDLSEITPQEVSMSGEMSLFPMSDYSCIFAKAWNNDGTIRTVKYIPQQAETPQIENKTDILNDIVNRLENIETLLKPYEESEKK